jgi:hypothetical protein
MLLQSDVDHSEVWLGRITHSDRVDREVYHSAQEVHKSAEMGWRVHGFSIIRILSDTNNRLKSDAPRDSPFNLRLARASLEHDDWYLDNVTSAGGAK